MAYLNITPTIDAMRLRPSDFELRRGNLVHTPSRHTFRFNRWGSARVDAECDCALLLISLEQSRDLKAAFDVWRNEYWRVVEINREFAAHFRPPGRARRFYEALKGVLGLGDARTGA
jgi:hypothetical protein